MSELTTLAGCSFLLFGKRYHIQSNHACGHPKCHDPAVTLKRTRTVVAASRNRSKYLSGTALCFHIFFKTFYLTVNVFSTKVIFKDTKLEPRLPFYEASISATRRSKRLRGKESTLISQLF